MSIDKNDTTKLAKSLLNNKERKQEHIIEYRSPGEVAGVIAEKFVPPTYSLENYDRERRYTENLITDLKHMIAMSGESWAVLGQLHRGVFTAGNIEIELDGVNADERLIVVHIPVELHKDSLKDRVAYSKCKDIVKLKYGEYKICDGGMIKINYAETVYKSIYSTKRIYTDETFIPAELFTCVADNYYIDEDWIQTEVKTEFKTKEESNERIYDYVQSIMLHIPERLRGLYNSNDVIAALQVASEVIKKR